MKGFCPHLLLKPKSALDDSMTRLSLPSSPLRHQLDLGFFTFEILNDVNMLQICWGRSCRMIIWNMLHLEMWLRMMFVTLPLLGIIWDSQILEILQVSTSNDQVIGWCENTQLPGSTLEKTKRWICIRVSRHCAFLSSGSASPTWHCSKKAAECHFLEVSNESKGLSSEKNHKYLTNILKGNPACATSLRGRGCKPCQLRFVMTIDMAFITSFSWWAISLRCGQHMDFGPNDFFNRNLLSRSWNETGLFFRILAASEVQNVLFWRSRGSRKSNTVSRNCVLFSLSTGGVNQT